MPSISYKGKSKKHRLLPLSHRVDTLTIYQKKKKPQKKIQAEKTAVKAARKCVLDNICKSIVTAQKNNNGKTPHHFIHTIVSSHTTVCPWVTRYVINKALGKYKTHVIPTLENCNVDTVAHSRLEIRERKPYDIPIFTERQAEDRRAPLMKQRDTTICASLLPRTRSHLSIWSSFGTKARKMFSKR